LLQRERSSHAATRAAFSTLKVASLPAATALDSGGGAALELLLPAAEACAGVSAWLGAEAV
jgi:hypothetical protein